MERYVLLHPIDDTQHGSFGEAQNSPYIHDKAKQEALFAVFQDNLVTGTTESLDSFKKHSTETVPTSPLKSFSFTKVPFPMQ